MTGKPLLQLSFRNAVADEYPVTLHSRRSGENIDFALPAAALLFRVHCEGPLSIHASAGLDRDRPVASGRSRPICTAILV